MVSAKDDCCSTQIIDANGNFDAQGLERFFKTVKLADKGLSYAVVSIMGPQSSGKSTLLNHLFRTNFREMNAFSGRIQTTKGVWVAKALGIEPFTMVMDLEGTDGRERGEDDTAFEKQSALFALAVSDIVLVNIWCHDIGREHAANRPLLKTVFQVMLRLFSPRKTTLLLVIRDKTKTPLEYLEKILREDIQKIWDSVPKPEEHKDTPLSEFFNVEVTALSSYEDKEEKFKQEVAELRKRFFHSIAPGGLAGDRRGVIPASGFSYSAQQIWKVISENKDLDLPAHKVMVATYRCEEIANEKLELLASNKDWLELEKAVKYGPIPSFGKKLSSILDAYLSEYDAETLYFDEGVRTAKRQFLKSRALQYVSPAFEAMVGHISAKALEKFKNDLEKSLDSGKGYAISVRDCTGSSLHVFDNECADIRIKHANWDTSKAREKLCHDIEVHASAVLSIKLSELQADYERKVKAALVEPLEGLLDAAGPHTWESVRRLFKRETEKALSDFSSSLSTFELDKEKSDEMKQNLKDYAQRVVESKAREEAGKVLIRMKDRFLRVFSHDEESMPRVWTGKEDIRYITKAASAEALELLSALAAIRLDDKPDRIQNILKSTLLDAPATQTKRLEGASDPLASSTWPEIPPEKTLITPVRCKSIWKQFKTEIEYTVAQAVAAQEAHRLSKSSIPPLWTMLVIAVLGFNEFMALLRNPLYLLLLFVAFLVSKALWHQLNMEETFQHGTLSGLLTLSGRFLPAVMNLLRKLSEQAQGYSENAMAHLPDSLTSHSYSSQSHKQTQMPSFSSTDSSPQSGIANLYQHGDSDSEETIS